MREQRCEQTNVPTLDIRTVGLSHLDPIFEGWGLLETIERLHDLRSIYQWTDE